MEYHEIGEKFEYNGVMLEVIDSKNVKGDCFCCYFKNCLCPALEMKCTSTLRLDNKGVIYKLIEQCKPKDMEQENKTEARKNDRLDDKLR